MAGGSRTGLYIALVLCVASLAAAGYLYLQLNTTKSDLSSAQQDVKNIQSRLTSANKEKTELESIRAEREEEIRSLGQRIAAKQQELNRVKQRVSELEATIEEHKVAMIEQEDLKRQLKKAIKQKEALERRLATTRDKYEKEIKQLQDRKLELEQKLQELTGEIPGAVEIENVRIITGKKFTGKVIAVNQEHNFIIIDIGKNDGIEEGTILIVHRGKDFITKVQVARVRDTVSAADLLDEWKQDDVKKGDGVKKF